MRIGIFVDGTFIPERDGASTRFANLPRHLNCLGAEVIIFHCYRGWSQLDLISKEPYRTYFISPEKYYSDFSLIRRLLINERIDIVQMNDLETMHRLGFSLTKGLDIYLIYEALYHSSTLAKQIGKSIKEIANIKKLEHEISRYCDEIITLTNEDKIRWIADSYCNEEHISIIPFGINLNINTSNISQRGPYMVFMGNMYFEPNIRALKQIVCKIYPTVKSQYSKAKCLVIGDIPYAERALCEKEGFEITGEVSDIKPLLFKSRVGLAPIFEGSGVRAKILSYLSCGIPVVATSIAAEGINFPALFVEDDMEQFSLLCVEILRKYKSYGRLLYDTIEIMKRIYSWENIAREALKVYKKVLSRSPKERPKNLFPSNNLPMWLNEVISKGRFPDADNLSHTKYHYGIAADGKVKMFY